MKQKRGKIKAIIFDVNGVLVKGEGRSIHEYMAKKLKVNMDDWFDTIEPYWDEMVKDEATTEYCLHKIANHYKIPKHKLQKLLIKAFKKHFKKNRQMFRLAKKLRKNYKTGILSDQLQMSYEAEKKFDLDNLVDVPIWSQKEGFRKPDIEFYKLALKHIKIPAENCLFIDNRDWNLVPAKKLGMHYILFYNYKQLSKQLKELGVKW